MAVKYCCILEITAAKKYMSQSSHNGQGRVELN